MRRGGGGGFLAYTNGIMLLYLKLLESNPDWPANELTGKFLAPSYMILLVIQIHSFISSIESTILIHLNGRPILSMLRENGILN